MTYRIRTGEEPRGALRRIAAEQIGAALEAIDDDDLDPNATVHEVRKRCKKIRGLLRLFRPALPAYSAENACFRDTARGLSELRDAAALVESCEALAARFSDALDRDLLAALREELVGRREATARSPDTRKRLHAARQALESAKERLGDWSLEADGFESVAAGSKKVHRRARRGMRRARREPSDENLHEWRKRVKYHRYHLRLLRELWPPVMAPLRDAAKRLSDRLGDDHDLAVLRRVITAESEDFAPGAADRWLPLVDQRRHELQAWALPDARRLLGQKPGRLEQQLRRYWEAWKVEQRLSSTLACGSDALS